MAVLSPRFVDLFHETRAARTSFEEYGVLVVNQQFADAYSHCGRDFRQAVHYDEFVEIHQGYQLKYGPLKSVKLVSYHVDGEGTPPYWTATFYADFTYRDETTRFEYVLHKEDGNWVIFGVKEL